MEFIAHALEIMPLSTSRPVRSFVLFCVPASACLIAGSHPLSAATQSEINRAISGGVSYLRSQMASTSGGQRSLVALALVKAGAPASSPEIKETLDAVRNKVKGGAYKPHQNHLYEAGVDAMLLADSAHEIEDGGTHPYRAEIEAIAAYIRSHQLSNGGWDYPPPQSRGTKGDTSVTQYAMLGLWAANRAGIEVPPDVWQQALQWHVASQNSDGGFAYTPGAVGGERGDASLLNMTINAIGSSYIALLQINPGYVPNLRNPQIRQQTAPKTGDDLKYGVLERVDLEARTAAARERRQRVEIPPATSQLLNRANAWFVPRFAVENTSTTFPTYYYYSLERMAALANVSAIGNVNWYDVCADHLLKKQQADGGWKYSMAALGPLTDTSFVILFLSRATAKTLQRTIPVDPIGGGLMAGGRGGLDNNPQTAVGGPKKNLGPLDQLLASLESTGDVDVADVQEQIVEKVQIGDRAALIGQSDLLVKYVAHPNVEVRRTAVWALGRTDNLSLARRLVDALDDPDLDVMIEARNALCWLARKPNGLGEAANPFVNLPEDAAEEQRTAAIATWHADVLKRWGTWYLDNRPYADRGDEFEAELLQKIAAL